MKLEHAAYVLYDWHWVESFRVESENIVAYVAEIEQVIYEWL